MAKRTATQTSIPLRADAEWLFRTNRKGKPEPVCGSGVVLYDAGNRATLEQSILGEIGVDIFADESALKDFARNDSVWLMTVGLQENDGPFVAQWYVGPPPSRSELAAKPAHKPRKKRLSLPTGEVHLEGSEAFSFGPDGAPNAGAVISIKPGLYDVSLNQAPDPAGGIRQRYFYLSFAFVAEVQKPQVTKKTKTVAKGEQPVSDEEKMKRYDLGKKHAFSGKPGRYTDLYYKRGLQAGKKDRGYYDKGFAQGLAGKPCTMKAQLAYKRGWKAGDKKRAETTA